MMILFESDIYEGRSISNLPRYEGMAFDTIFPHHCDPNDISAYPAKFQQNRTNSKKVRVIYVRTALDLKRSQIVLIL